MKNIIDELIKHELHYMDAMLETLEDLKLVQIPPKGFLTESDGWCWFEENPRVEDKKRLLTALGYDVSKL